MKPVKTNDRWTTYDPPWVMEDPGAPFRYWVESKSHPDSWNLVDLTARGGEGRCSCVFFQMVCEPNLKRIGDSIPFAPQRQGVTDCRHICAARAHYDKYVTKRMFKEFANGIQTNQP